MSVSALEAELTKVREENELLRKRIAILERQVRNINPSDELRRAHAKIAEWEGSTREFNGVFHHGQHFIRKFLRVHNDE